MSKCCNIQQVIDSFYNKILAYIKKNIKETQLAEDIAQEVMGKLIIAYNKNTPIENMQAWLFQITRNLISDHYRSMKYNISEIDDKIPNTEEAKNNFYSEEDFIIPMIKLLPEEYATPLYLADIEKRKQNEIAQQLNIGLSATKMRIQRARKMLREQFESCCDIEYNNDGSFASCNIKTNCSHLQDEEEKLRKKSNQ